MRARVHMAAVAASLALLSCGGDGGEPASQATATPTADAAAAAALNGTFSKTIREEDAGPSGGAQPGVWRLVISGSDAHFEGPKGRIPLQPRTLSSTRMVVPPDPNCPNNRPAPGDGIYDVRLKGSKLDFEVVRDSCGDRAFTLTVHEWRRER